MSEIQLEKISNLAGDRKVGIDYVIGGSAKVWAAYGTDASPAAIRDSLNISSLVDNAQGDVTLNFTTALQDGNYAAPTSYNLKIQYLASLVIQSKTASQMRLQSWAGTAGSAYDCSDNNVIVMGDLA